MSGTKPRVLVAIDWYLPGFRGGGPIRSVANMVVALSEQFEFWVLTSDRDYGMKQPHANIQVDQWTDGPNGEKVWYCSPDANGYRHFKAILADTEYDLLYLNSMFSLRYSIYPLWTSRSSFPDKPVLLAPRGMLHAGALSLKPTKKKIFLRLLNWLGIPKQIQFHATDAQEQTDIRLHFGGESKVYLAPNIAQITLPDLKPIRKERGKLNLVYLSRLSAKKGLHTLLELLRTQKATIELRIVGPDEEPGYWAQCSAIISTLPANIHAHKQEAVSPDQATNILQAAHVFALPTLGENFGHSIFESFAAGRPVLISEKTPWHGLKDVFAGYEIPLSNLSAWEEAIRAFAEMDQSEFDMWTSGARVFAERHQKLDQAIPMTANMFHTARQSTTA